MQHREVEGISIWRKAELRASIFTDRAERRALERAKRAQRRVVETTNPLWIEALARDGCSKYEAILIGQTKEMADKAASLVWAWAWLQAFYTKDSVVRAWADSMRMRARVDDRPIGNSEWDPG